MIKKPRKIRFIDIRCTDLLFKKLMAICAETGKTRTAVIEDLINKEYDNNKRYEKRFMTESNREG